MSERRLADQLGHARLLQDRGEDLARSLGGAVDQHYQRPLPEPRPLVGERLDHLGAAHQSAQLAVDEEVGHTVGGLARAARDAAHIEQQSCGPLGRQLLQQSRDGGDRVGREAGQAQHRKAILELHRGLPGSEGLESQRLLLALATADDLELELGPGLAGEEGLDLPERHAPGATAVDLSDRIAALQPDILTGAARRHRQNVRDAALLDQRHSAVPYPDLAGPSIALDLGGGNERRHRVERVGGAVERAGEEDVDGRLLDVGAPYQVEHFGEDRQALVERILLGLVAGDGAGEGARSDSEDHQDRDDGEEGAAAGHLGVGGGEIESNDSYTSLAEDNIAR